MQIKVILFPRRLCETIAGNFAYVIGRVAFRPGQPMLVEHVGGIYLKHDLAGIVLTSSYGREYDIAHVHADPGSPVCTKGCAHAHQQNSYV